MKDLFAEDLIDSCQQAIDGGYAKTKHIGLAFTPNEDTLEFRGDSAKAVVYEALKRCPRATRIGIGILRKDETFYVVSLLTFLRRVPMIEEHRLYPIPLDPELWLDAGAIEAALAERAHRE